MFSPHKAFPPGPAKFCRGGHNQGQCGREMAAPQNFADLNKGEARDNVAEAHPRENFRGAGGRSPRQCGRSRRPGKRLEYAKRLEQVERLKAEERMKNPTQNFAEGEAGITPRMREKLDDGHLATVSPGDHPAHAGTDTDEEP